MSKLCEILRQEVLAEIGEIQGEADSRAEMIIREAETKASDRVAAYEKKAEARLRAATFLAESSAGLIVSTARVQARSQVMALVEKRAMTMLERIAAGPDFDRILETLAEEALKATEKVEALVVHPNDEGRLAPWARRKGLKVRTDPGLQLGVRMVGCGGQRSVENSLPERLHRAWETLASGVAQRLWGDGGQGGRQD